MDIFLEKIIQCCLAGIILGQCSFICAGQVLSQSTLLQTGRLTIRPFVVDDASDLFHLLSNPAVVNQTRALRQHSNLAETEHFLKSIIRTYHFPAQKSNLLLGIVEQESRTLIGYCGFFGYGQACQQAELGYALVESHWGKGYATEAARALVDFGFSRLGLQKITATVYAENAASINVLTKIGMRQVSGFMVTDKDGSARKRLLFSKKVV